MTNFTHFCSKTTNISEFITPYISKNATVIVHVYTITVAFYLIIKSKFSLSSLAFVLSSPVSLFSLTLFNPKKKTLYYLAFFNPKKKKKKKKRILLIERRWLGYGEESIVLKNEKNKEREREREKDCVCCGWWVVVR